MSRTGGAFGPHRLPSAAAAEHMAKRYHVTRIPVSQLIIKRPQKNADSRGKLNGRVENRSLSCGRALLPGASQWCWAVSEHSAGSPFSSTLRNPLPQPRRIGERAYEPACSWLVLIHESCAPYLPIFSRTPTSHDPL